MDWVEKFYSITGDWWGEAESPIGPIDRLRARFIHETSPDAQTVLELGCGYGSTAVAIAEGGRSVTGIDLSTRLEHAPDAADGSAQLRLIRGDFYEVHFEQTFDVVCYWDGFGIGIDEDQRRLLRRIADDWLSASGVAIIEVSNPAPWANDVGLFEIKEPDPQRGYQHRLGHRREFDLERNVALDTWWVIGSEKEWTQSLRCYSPEDLEQLVASTGLTIQKLATFDGHAITEKTELGVDCWSYIATLGQ